MFKTILSLCVLLALSAGCAQISVRDKTPPPAAPPVADDTRGAAEVQKDNAQLRQRLTRLESDYSGWQGAVDKREAEKRDLKRQRDQLKKDRDHWKDLAKKDD